MKQQVKNFLSYVNKALLLPSLKNQNITGSKFIRTAITGAKDNTCNLLRSTVDKVKIDIKGQHNIIECNDAYLFESNISITGTNNKLEIHPGVKLRGARVIIRGDNCVIKIGSHTTFEGIRMVNVGKDNDITIGSDCLFSDNIELWASDTHSILNEHGEFINPERPVRIGNKVWVGAKVTILKGVTISDGSIIGMGSVVTKDVPANVVSAGYPNKTIKENVSWKNEYSK